MLHEPSEIVLKEELDSIKKTLDPKTPIVWLKEILSLEVWEEELFQGGDGTLPLGFQTTWNQLSHHITTTTGPHFVSRVANKQTNLTPVATTYETETNAKIVMLMKAGHVETNH